MPTNKFWTFCPFLRAFFTSAGRMSQKKIWVLVMYFERPIHIILFLHSFTLAFILRSLFTCHPPYRYLIWHFFSTLLPIFIANWSYYCVSTIFYLWGLDDLFYVIFQFWVLSFDKYVGLVESHASNLTLGGWRLLEAIFLRIRELYPNILCWVYNWFRSDISCYCYVLLSFINNLDLT